MKNTVELGEFHWLLAIVQSIDVGIIVIDRQYQIEVWNGFIENHSGLKPDAVAGMNLFELFPDIDRQWLTQKVESVSLLGIPAFTVWEQRPYLLRFKGYHPITGNEEFMYQNTTLLPLKDTHGQIAHIAIILYDVTKVAMHHQQLQKANGQLKNLSRTDRLTGLFNRGYWEECLNQEFTRFQRYGSECSLVMFDIDHFKRINDTYGHQAGDAAIRAVADITREYTRNTDFCGRYGGEEFVVLLPGTDIQGATVLAERLREAVERNTVVHSQIEIRFTISLGVSQLHPVCVSGAQLLEQADGALYVSKQQGRNRVTLHGQNPSKTLGLIDKDGLAYT